MPGTSFLLEDPHAAPAAARQRLDELWDLFLPVRELQLVRDVVPPLPLLGRDGALLAGRLDCHGGAGLGVGVAAGVDVDGVVVDDVGADLDLSVGLRAVGQGAGLGQAAGQGQQG